MNIDFVGETTTLPDGCLQLLEKLMSFTVNQEIGTSNIEIAISFVNDETIQQLNKQYRNLNEPTDVLSFPLFEKIDFGGLDESIPASLGDIIISIDRAKKQATEYNHSFKREICFLAVHGLLHLLGYDHMHEKDEKVMFRKQKEILEEFDLER